MESIRQLTFEKTKGFADGRGLAYEIKVSALLFLRALQLTERFYIASNMAGVGAFDDVVMSYKLKGSHKWKTCFVQLKHKTSKRDITVQSLTDLKRKGDFCLVKYCKSYSEIKKLFQVGGSEDPMFRSEFRDTEFVIFTNANMDTQLSNRQRHSHCFINPLLQTNEQSGLVFSFSETSDQDIYNYLRDLLKLKVFLNSLNFAGISDEEYDISVNQFNASLSSEHTQKLVSSLCSENVEKMKSELRDLEDCNDFLSNILYFAGQLSEKDMDSVLLTEIQNIFCTNDDDTQYIWNNLYVAVSHWWKEENYYLTETTPFWQEIIKTRLHQLNEQKRNEIANLSISFQNISLQPNLNTPELNIVTKSPLLTCSKVCQTLQTPHILMGLQSILTLKREVLALWPSEWCTTLVVEWEDVEQSVEFLYFEHPQRRLLIVSRKPVKCAQSINDVTHFCDIDQCSQHMIGEKEIILQGSKVKLKSLLTDDRKHLINEDILLQILNSTEVTVGNSIQAEVQQFIPRSLSHFVYLKDTFLNTHELSGVVAISGAHKEDISRLSSEHDVCIAIQTSSNSCKYLAIDDRNYDNVTTQNKQSKYSPNVEREVDPNLCRVTIIHNSVEFNILCEYCQNVHWIEIQADKKLMWIKSKGDISDIEKCIDKNQGVSYNLDKMLTISDRVILIISEPGMGKSTLVAQISTTFKQRNPTKWVVLVRLNDYTDLLHKYLNKETSTDLVNELMIQAAGTDDSELGKFLFDSAMRHMENVVVLLDGMDEISPNYTNIVFSFISDIIEKEVSQIWLTSRPLPKNILEKKLCVLPYALLPFTVDDQLSYLETYWASTHPHIESSVKREFASQLIQINTNNLSEVESKFMSIPLQARMMAECFQHDLKHFKGEEDVVLPEKMNLIELFKKFVQFKYDLFTEKKMKIDLSNVAFKSIFGKEYDKYDEKHALSSLAVLVLESYNTILRPKHIINNLKDVAEELESDIFRIGIIDGVVNNKPHFIHRSFAEYFCAQWLARNYKQNKEFLRSSLCQPELQVMLRMLNYMICESFDLHMAVLNNDINEVKKLLRNEIYVDQPDEYDRTALHLASYYDHRKIAEELIINGADFYKEDFLSCSALDYAERNKSWATVDILLYCCKLTKRRLMFKTNKLIVLNENLTHPNYGISALSESAEKGYIELAKYLQSNGLDLKNTTLNTERQTALHIAVRNKQYEIVDTVLDTVMSHKQFNITKWIWKQKLPAICNNDTCNIEDTRGYTPLMYASKRGNISIIEKLLLHGANINARSKYGKTALHTAVRKGHLPTVEFLLAHDADSNIADIHGRIPVHTAAIHGHLPIVKYFLKENTLSAIVDSYGDTLLHAAAYKSHVFLAEYFLEHNVCIDTRNNEGETALFLAACKGHLPTVELILLHGADINITNKNGLTPTHVATLCGHLPIVKTLIEKGVVLAIVDSNGDSPLHLAAYNGHVSLVEYLLQQNIGIDVRTKDGETALHMAARRGHLRSLECLLRHGADVNISDNNGLTPFLTVCFHGHLHIVKDLLERESLLKTADSWGNTLLHAASFNGEMSVVEYLCDRNVGIDICNKDGATALYTAAFKGHLSTVECLLLHGADINIVDNEGRNPVHIATIHGQLSIVKFLIRAGTLPTVVDFAGNTLLHSAAHKGHVSLAEYILECNMGIGLLNKKGETALHLAAIEGHLPIVECLLLHEADVNIADNNGRTPIHAACLSGHLPIVKKLLEREPDLAAVDSDGNTALHAAVYKGHVCLVEYLLKHQVDVDICNKDGKTAMYFAAQEGFLSAVELLVSHGGHINIPANEGHTPLRIAEIEGHSNIVEYLGKIGEQS